MFILIILPHFGEKQLRVSHTKQLKRNQRICSMLGTLHQINPFISLPELGPKPNPHARPLDLHQVKLLLLNNCVQLVLPLLKGCTQIFVWICCCCSCCCCCCCCCCSPRTAMTMEGRGCRGSLDRQGFPCVLSDVKSLAFSLSCYLKTEPKR